VKKGAYLFKQSNNKDFTKIGSSLDPKYKTRLERLAMAKNSRLL
jgi:hypothetical protein